MPTSPLNLAELDDTVVPYSITGQSVDGSASYKNVTRSLSLPQTLDFAFKIGAPGSKANDKVEITLKNVVVNGTTAVVSTGSLKVIVSIPRDSAWLNVDTEDLLAQMATLLSDANCALLADAIVP